MEASENSVKLYYNTEVEKLQMPEYGRNVLKMVEQLKDIPDRAKRSEQAAAVVGCIASRPDPIPLNTKPIRARHYGRNIESILDLIASEPEGETKTAMIRSLAIYMRQQYLIWNKDTVADATIFQDIERLSGGRVKVPEGIELSKISADASFSRPGMNLNFGGNKGGKFNRNFRGKKGKK